MYYFVYVKDLIAIETDKKNFVWTFGRSLHQIDKRSFDQFLIKIHLSVEKDRQILIDYKSRLNYSKFSSFFVSVKERELIFQKILFKTVAIAFKLKIDGNDIYFSVGRAYYNLVKLRLMNLHSARYVLSDLVSGMLLLNNYAPLYCAAVSLEEKLIMIFGGPSVGKTLSATQLLKRDAFSLLSEDILVSDGSTFWSVPFTSTYGQHNKGFKRNRRFIEGELITKFSDSKYIFLLENGSEETNISISEKILLLNRYVFHYNYSPVTTVCAYFFEDFDLNQMRANENKIVKKICDDSVCKVLYENDSFLFADKIIKEVIDNQRQA